MYLDNLLGETVTTYCDVADDYVDGEALTYDADTVEVACPECHSTHYERIYEED